MNDARILKLKIQIPNALAEADIFQKVQNKKQSSNMEQSTSKYPDFKIQLQNLSNLQARIEETKRSLNKLMKIETNENKHITSIYKMSIATTRNKLNLFESHSLNNNKHSHESQELQLRQQKVKEMREKQQRELKEIRGQMKANKENERLNIKNKSQEYNQTIKRNRQLELHKKEEMVRELKNNKKQHKESIDNSRLLQKKQKETKLFNTTLAKIETQPSLAKELDNLIKQKEDIQSRVKQRKEIKEKLKMQAQRLRRMKSEEFVKILIQTQRLSPLKENNKEKQLAHIIKSLVDVKPIISLMKDKSQI